MEKDDRPATDLSAAVAKEVRVLLIRRDMKQSEMAAKMGVTEMWLSRRLRGAQAIDINDLGRMAAVLGVEAADLLPRNDAGRLISTGGHTGHSPVGINDRSNQRTERTRPGGHPNHHSPHDTTRRPGRTAHAPAH